MHNVQDARRTLEELVEEIAGLQLSGCKNEQRDASVQVFRRLLVLVSRAKPEDAPELLHGVGKKAPVLRFVIDFHQERKIYRRQAVALLVSLLKVPAWRDELDHHELLMTALPEDVWTTLDEPLGNRTSGWAQNEEDRLEVVIGDLEEFLASPSPSEEAPQPSRGLTDDVAPEWSPLEASHPPDETIPGQMAAPSLMTRSFSLPGSFNLLRQAAGEGFASQRHCAHAIGSHQHPGDSSASPREHNVPPRPRSSMGTLCQSSVRSKTTALQLLEEGCSKMAALNFKVSDFDIAGSAFDMFYTAVVRMTKFSLEDHVKHLEALKPKTNILEFLAELLSLKPVQKHRITMVVDQLLMFQSWQVAAQSIGLFARVQAVAPLPAVPEPVAAEWCDATLFCLGRRKSDAQHCREIFGFRRRVRSFVGERRRSWIGQC